MPGSDEPRSLCEGRGRSIYIVTKQSILLVTMQSLDLQVEALLRVKRIPDAMALAEFSLSSEDKMDVNKKQQLMRNISTRAAFMLLREGAFPESVEYLLKGIARLCTEMVWLM